MRLLVRKNIDSAGAVVIMDTSFTYADQKRGREHYENIKQSLLSMVSREMEAVYDNPAHNYMDVLVTRKTV